MLRNYFFLSIYGKIHSSVSNSSDFDKCRQCNHHCDQDTERYCPVVVSPFLCSQALATSTDPFSVPIISPFPKIDINGTHTEGDLLSLASVPWHNAFEFHPCCCISFFHFVSYIPLYGFTTV